MKVNSLTTATVIFDLVDFNGGSAVVGTESDESLVRGELNVFNPIVLLFDSLLLHELSCWEKSELVSESVTTKGSISSPSSSSSYLDVLLATYITGRVSEVPS